MTAEEFITIWVPARNALYPEGKRLGGKTKASQLMREALGARATKEHIEYYTNKDYPMDEELKRILLLLAGPHAHTILKAYRIRKGLGVV